MKQVLVAKLKFLNETIWIVCNGYQNNQFVDTDNNVWQSDEIELLGWTMMKL